MIIIACLLHAMSLQPSDACKGKAMTAAPETIKFKRLPEKRRLNKRTIEALAAPPFLPGRDGKKPKPGQAWIYDDETPRLAICVWSTGVRTWYWIGGIKGKMMRYKLGKYPEMTPEQAKKAAGRISAKVAEDIDPRLERRRVREEVTLLGMFERFFDEHSKQHKRTWKHDEAMFDRYCGSIKSRTLSSIDTASIMALHSRIGRDHGKYSANRLVALLSKLFNFAAKVGYTGGNPCKGVQKFKEESRERFMTADELTRFFAALEDEVALFQDFFKVLLLTGARRSNVQSMEWAELQLDEATWRIPGEKFKNGKNQDVHLSAEVVQILKRRKAESKGGPWVFPGGKRNQASHLDSPKGAWKRVCTRAKLTNLRMHDLRRTLGSWQAATGASLPVIGKTLGHQNTATTAIYARLNIDPVRDAVDTAVAAMMAAANKKGDEHVQ
jgi:integrase